MDRKQADRYPSDAVAVPDDRPERSGERALGDFAFTPAMARLALLAPAIAILVTVLALGLLELIGAITHLVYTGTLATSITTPDTSKLGAWSIFVPVVGGLIVGAMAKLGSERIRGHGIPEAMETILLRGSRMEPRLAVLKPLSSAVSIGMGGPFGAEGPIIVTGGAVGSIVGQLMHLTAAERRCLLVGGAAAGMTAVFGTPLASVLLAVELLLFEWRPRSIVPVALAACTAEVTREALVRAGLLHAAPLFPVTATAASGGMRVAAGAVVVGVAGGALAWAMTKCVYGAEDLFGRLPLHWAWWPAIGGLVVGVGGLLDPRVLGVGYETIGAELAGRLALGALVSLLLVKLVVWSVALGSNTSGGILAPLLMLGAALGAVLGAVLPGADTGTWALLGMAAAMAGVMRSPFTSIVFALELTHDVNALLPLTIVCTIAYLVSVATLKRSILTEKIARRGFHVSREYEVDPLHALLVRDVMSAVTAEYEPLRHEPVIAQAGETLRQAADRMLASGYSVLPVFENGDPPRLVGVVRQADLLKAHERVLVEERVRERPLRPARRLEPTPEAVP
ncbi:MAG TPA: chloride channel protein [Solirubrobacteraceae bacterium]|nr:chloride channel protein [Solirubrobacteraceae bacterium]